MFKSICHIFRGVIVLLAYNLATLIFIGPMLFVAILKLLIPIESWRRFCSGVLNAMSAYWVDLTNPVLTKTTGINIEVIQKNNLSDKNWYLLLVNHQSWADCLVLAQVFHRKIPYFKFFMKNELVYVPVLGLAFWALDFPRVKRYSKNRLKKKPHLKGRDLLETKRSCEKFKSMPVSIVNFVEGTRFTEEKHKKQNSPFKNLLKPKAGGTALVLYSMAEYIDHIINVTIVYPGGIKNLWNFLCGRVKNIKVIIESHPINVENLGNYFDDQVFKKNFNKYINSIWEEKDHLIELVKNRHSLPITGGCL